MDRFPVGFWNYTRIGAHPVSAAMVRDWDECGMTLAMGPEYVLPDDDAARTMRAILDECAARNIKVILWQDGCTFWHLHEHGEEYFRKNVGMALEAFGDHPAVFGLHCGDEPRGVHTEPAFRCVRIQKEMAPHWKPFLNLLPWHQNIHPGVHEKHWPDYLDTVCEQARPEILAYDCYYHMNPGEEGWEIYFKNLEHFSAAARRHNIIYWPTLMCTAHFNYRIPTEDDLRWQLGSALAWGARGIVWFFMYLRDKCHGVADNFRLAPINEFWERTETYRRLSYINRQFLNTTAPVLNVLAFKQAYNIGLTWGWGGYPFKADGRRVISATGPGPLIVSEFQHPDGADYVALTNNSNLNNVEATIAVRGRNPQLKQVGFAGQEFPGGARERGTDFTAATQWFAPGQMALFRVVDETPG